jgi:hypothetical protein
MSSRRPLRLHFKHGTSERAGRFPPSQTVELLYQRRMAESVILFIEDELDHFEALREHLEPDFKCARSRALHVETVAEEIEELRPVAVILDLMLFSSHRAAKAGMAAYRRSIALLEGHLDNELTPTRPTRSEENSIEAPVMASDWLRQLKGSCPGVPLVAFSQLEATAHSLEDLVSAAIAKRLDTNARLVNGKEVAEKIRQLIKG